MFSVEAVSDLSDIFDLMCLLGFQWAVLRECTHHLVKCFLLDLNNDTFITLEGITFIRYSE